MKRLILKRVSSTTKCTLGVLIDSESGFIVSLMLELPWKFNRKSESCIPDGDYVCEPYSSDKYKNVFQVVDVTGRSHILIHSGNTVNDTNGCLLPGVSFGTYKENEAVFQSKNSLSDIKKYVGDKSFKLTIKSV